jgi:DNA-binding NtrC family response regulator
MSTINPKLLIVEDEEILRLSLSESLSRNGFEVQLAESGKQAIKLWEQNGFDLILLDVKLPGGIDGIEVLERIREVDRSVLVIMMTAHADVEAAVRAMKLGAYDYINKPFLLDEMKLVLQKAMETRNLRAEVDYLRRQQRYWSGASPLISQHPKMKQVFEVVDRVAGTPRTSVLIQGESGTGKEIITQLIHNQSARRQKPFVKIDCSTISETLLDSELFGHKKGAFTDAKEDKKGLFEHANGGTVFLEEIGEMKLSLQPKLLQVLETQTLRRVGDLRDIKVDVRVVAATNRDLYAMVQERKFREDLYYRLKVMLIELPPIRERSEDIIPLAEHFINGFNREFRKNIKSITPSAQQMLSSYSWPGNVRELKNAIERAVILADGDTIEPKHLPLELNNRPVVSDGLPQLMDAADKSLEEMECSYIQCVLQKTQGNKSVAAEILGISRSTLWQKLKKYGVAEE